MNSRTLLMAGAAILMFAVGARGEIKIVVEHNPNQDATPQFKFKNVPSPSKRDAATTAKFTIVDGERDGNGGELDVLHDGQLPREEDEPAANFFFNAGTEGGRISIDLGSMIEVKQVNTFSWHPNTRGPQVYKLYASDGKADDFKAEPKHTTDPEKCGWKLVAKVDTRPKTDEGGGQYGVSISDSEGAIGSYRYLLFDIVRTENDDLFGNTFYSEIDVIGKDDSTPVAVTTPPYLIRSTDGYCEIAIDTSAAPELEEWATNKLAPVLAEWYPKITAALSSENYAAPKAFRVLIRPGRGVAATGGTNVTANSTWLKRELNREAIGAILHEEVHVVQQYGRARRNPDAKPTPGWLTEGIPDYIRWFQYEPLSHGADVVWMRARPNLTLKYDARYRISANFLNYVVEHYDKDLIRKLNAACRQGKYADDLWKSYTGKTVEELNDEWTAAIQKEIAATGVGTGQTKDATQETAAAESKINSLTEAEKTAGWKLLFDGKDLAGWHNFKREGVRPGWQVKDGSLVCVDPHNAGDIVTTDKFDWFELQLDYNISQGGNSGIMYHVSDEGDAVWATGPEVQLEDNQAARDPQRCGWLYGLYQPPIDDKTGKPLDATKPAGQWNHVRLLISAEKCVHEVNGVKYFEYVLGSEDFKSRVAKSKFGSMPLFAKSDSGYIALQGDHGEVSFRNIKVKPLKH